MTKLPALPPRQRQLELIESEILTTEDLAFTHTIFAQCFLPYRSLRERVYEAQHGKALLRVKAGELYDGARFVQQEVPTGAKARIVLTYVNTYAIRHNTSCIDMGDSLNDFLHKLEIPVGGSNYKAVLREVNNVASADFVLGGWKGDKPVTYKSPVFDWVELWGYREPEQRSLWQSEAHLSPRYFDILREHRMPADMRALKAFQSAPLLWDVYLYLAYRLPRLRGPTKIRWEALRDVFGPRYKELRFFRRRFVAALQEVLRYYPEARLSWTSPEYLELWPSPRIVDADTPRRKLL